MAPRDRIVWLSAALLAVPAAVRADRLPEPPLPSWTLRGRIVATGLPGAQGIRQVGRFHHPGPLTSNPEFLLQTQAGKVLDPERVLVALESNLGAPLALASQSAGSVLSIDTRAQPDGQPLRISAQLAQQSGHSPQPGAPIQIYTSQSAAHQNLRHNASARTARFTAAAGPRYLSINNAFGRPWIANTPFGLSGAGSVSVVDPDGAPLVNPPSNMAGGVFAGSDTPRQSVPRGIRSGLAALAWNQRSSPQLTPGRIDRGAFGTALLGASPDGSGLAVFAVATGDGAVAQVHVQDGVDGLAPAGTIDVGAEDPGVIGMAFKWNPERVLYLAEARRNRIVLLHLGDDTMHFTLQRVSYLSSPWLREPVDLAAAIPEIANPRFASHTTLAGGSDLYVANRGDGSLLRIDQEGQPIARAQIDVPGLGAVGGGRLRALAVAADAQRLWLVAEQTGTGTARESLLIEVPAFDEHGAFGSRPAVLSPKPATSAPSIGEQAFRTTYTPQTGLGPLFNAPSCLACHPGPGGASDQEQHFARRVARMDPSSGRLLSLDGQSSQLAPRFLARGPAQLDTAPAALPRAANVVSLRMPLPLYAIGRLDDIPDAAIQAQAVSKGDGIKGRVHRVTTATGEQRIGRYGWKADAATLDSMVAQALAGEMGIHSALASTANEPIEDDGTLVRALSAYLRALKRPSGLP